MEQEKTENLSRLGYLLKLILRAKRETRKITIYSWVISASCFIIGGIICYILFHNPTLRIEGSRANVNISVWAGDSLEVTADKVARYVYKAAQKEYVKRIVVSLSMAHLKASGHPPVDMGTITIDATEIRKHKDLASYISNNIGNIKSQISSLEYAKHLGDIEEPVKEAKPSGDVPDKPDLSVMVFNTIDYCDILVMVKGSKESVEFSTPKVFQEWLSKQDLERGYCILIAIYSDPDSKVLLTKIISTYSTLYIKKRASEDALDKAEKHIDTILSEFRKIIEEQGFTLKR